MFGKRSSSSNIQSTSNSSEPVIHSEYKKFKDELKPVISRSSERVINQAPSHEVKEGRDSEPAEVNNAEPTVVVELPSIETMPNPQIQTAIEQKPLLNNEDTTNLVVDASTQKCTGIRRIPCSLINFLLNLNIRSCSINQPTRDDEQLDWIFYRRRLSGGSFWFNLAWPAILYGYIINDLFSFSNHTENRFGNTVGDIFLGRSTNQDTRSTFNWIRVDSNPMSHWWLTPVVFTTMPIALKLLKLLKVFLSSCILGLERPENLTANSSSCFRQMTWDCISPLNTTTHSLALAVVDICFNLRGSLSEKKELIEKICVTTIGSRVCNQLEGVYALGEIYSVLDQQLKVTTNILLKEEIEDLQKWVHEKLARLAFFRDIEIPIDRVTIDSGGITLNTDIKSLDDNSVIGKLNPHLHSFYSNYLMWKLCLLNVKSSGKNILNYTKAGKLFSWITFTLFTTVWFLYPRGRYLEIIIRHLYNGIHFEIDKHNCESSNRVYEFLPVIGDYQCTPCGDWSFAHYTDIQSFEGCMRALMHESRNPDEINLRVRQLASRNANINLLDLSQQDISFWRSDQWREFLEGISQITNHLTLFNLTQSSPNTIKALDDQKVKHLARFITQTVIDNLEFKNIDLAFENNDVLFNSFVNKTIRSINIDNTNAQSNDAVNKFIRTLPSIQGLSQISIRDNDINNIQGVLLGQTLNNTIINRLDVAGNLFESEAINAIVSNAQTGTLRDIDLSHVSLDPDVFSTIGAQLPYLDSIRLVSTDINYEHVSILAPYLPQSKVRFWDFSQNFLGDDTVPLFINYLNPNTSTTLLLNSVGLGSSGLLDFSNNLSEKNLTEIQLSDNAFKSPSFCYFLRNTLHTPLRVLKINNARLDYQAVDCFVEMVNKNSSSLMQVSFSNNKFNSAYVSALLKTVNNSNIFEFDLSDNLLESKDLPPIGDLYQLQRLNLGGNKLNSSSVSFFSDLISQKKLNTLILDRMDLQDDFALPFLNSLIVVDGSGNFHRQELMHTPLSLDLAKSLNENTQATTALKKLSLSNSGLTKLSQTLACLTAGKPNGIMPDNLLSDSKNGKTNYTNRLNCEIDMSGKSSPIGLFLSLGSFSLNIFNSILFLDNGTASAADALPSSGIIRPTQNISTNAFIYSFVSVTFLLCMLGIVAFKSRRWCNDNASSLSIYTQSGMFPNNLSSKESKSRRSSGCVIHTP